MNSALQTTPAYSSNDASNNETQGLQILGVEAQPIVERRSSTIAKIASEAPLTAPRKVHKRTCRMAMASVAKTNKRSPDFRVLQTENKSLNLLVAAKNVESGLNKGETVVLVCEERPEVIERKFSMINVDVKSAIKNGQLVIISMAHMQDPYEMLTNTSYKQMFSDLKRFVQRSIGRIVVLELDKYLDLTTEYRAVQSMQEFYDAAAMVDCPVLTQAVQNESDQSELLVKVSREVTARFFSLVKDKKQLRLTNKATWH